MMQRIFGNHMQRLSMHIILALAFCGCSAEHFGQLQAADLAAGEHAALSQLLQLTQIDADQLKVVTNASHCFMKSCIMLEGKHVTMLQVYRAPAALSSMKFVNALRKLQTLDLQRNHLTRIEGLQGLAQLKSLSLNHNVLGSLQGLGSLPKLKSLYVNNNKLTSLAGLEDLPNLTSLYADNNQLSTLTGIDKARQPKLKKLSLNGNRLQDVRDIPFSTSLDTLSLANNELDTMSDLPPSKSLRTLNLDHNKLRDLRGVQYFPTLETLEVNSNQLTSIEGIQHLTYLYSFKASGNKLAGTSAAEVIKQAKNNKLRFHTINDVPTVRTGSSSRYSSGGGYGYGK